MRTGGFAADLWLDLGKWITAVQQNIQLNQTAAYAYHQRKNNKRINQKGIIYHLAHHTSKKTTSEPSEWTHQCHIVAMRNPLSWVRILQHALKNIHNTY